MKGRKYPDYGLSVLKSSDVPGLLEYVNTPRLIGALVSGKLATLWELQSIYGIMDAYNLLEILKVDQVNELKAQAHVRNRN